MKKNQTVQTAPKIKSLSALFITIGVSFTSFVERAQAATDWPALIQKFIRQQSDLLITANSSDSLILNESWGRLMINSESKFSYLIELRKDSSGKEFALLLPMSTSRYTPGAYSTTEWWEAHKAEIEAARSSGTPAPRQDPAEVLAWLKKMKLSTSPFVYRIYADGRSQAIGLQKYLIDLMDAESTDSSTVTLYRGAEKAGEPEVWASGQRPRGGRYWTPNALYAWRYARKSPTYIEQLLTGKGGVLKFAVPKSLLRQDVLSHRPRLYLGAELPGSAHDSFDRNGTFDDVNLKTSFYIGHGSLAADLELRSSSRGLEFMTRAYTGVLTAEEMYFEFQETFKKAYERLRQEHTGRSIEMAEWIKKQTPVMQAEVRVIYAFQKSLDPSVIEQDIAFLRKTSARLITKTLDRSDIVAVWQKLSKERTQFKSIADSQREMFLLNARLLGQTQYQVTCEDTFGAPR